MGGHNDRNDLSRNDRSYSSQDLLFDLIRGGGSIISRSDVDRQPNRAGGVDQNGAKVSLSGKNGLRGIRVIRSMAHA